MPVATLSDVGLSDVSMRSSLHRANFLATVKVGAAHNASLMPMRQNGRMEERWKNRIGFWRKKAKMTMDQLALAMDPPTSKGMISQYESGKRKPRQDTLASIAKALGTTPGSLLVDETPDGDSNVIRIWDRIPTTRRAQALDVLKTFTDAK